MPLTDDVQLKGHGHLGLRVHLALVDAAILGQRRLHMQRPLP